MRLLQLWRNVSKRVLDFATAAIDCFSIPANCDLWDLQSYFHGKKTSREFRKHDLRFRPFTKYEALSVPSALRGEVL